METPAPTVSIQTEELPQSHTVETAEFQAEQEPAEKTPVDVPVEAAGPAAPAHPEAFSDEMPGNRSPVEESPAVEPRRAIVTDFPAQAVQTEPSALELEEPEAEQAAAPRYTPDMPVEDILSLMTLEEAQSLIVDVGTCSGWTMAQVADRRAASLKWYVFGYKGDNNILRAAAHMMLDFSTEQKAG